MKDLLDRLEDIVEELTHAYTVANHQMLELEAKMILRQIREAMEL